MPAPPPRLGRIRLEHLAEFDLQRPALGIDQPRLVAKRNVAVLVGDLADGAEDVGYAEADAGALQDRHLLDQLGLLAKVGEQTQVQCGEAAEVEVGAAWQARAVYVA